MSEGEPLALDPQGMPVDLPPDQIADAWRSGKVQINPAGEFHVRMPDGSLFKQPGAGLQQALDRGATILSPAQLAQHQAARDYGGAAGGGLPAAGGGPRHGTPGPAQP